MALYDSAKRLPRRRPHTLRFSLTLALFACGLGLTISAHSQTQPSPSPASNDITDLNAAFFLKPAQVTQAIKNGRGMANKGWAEQDFLAKNGKNPVGIRGEKGVSHESHVICYALNGLGVSHAAFDSELDYTHFELPQGIDEKTGGTLQTVDFDILLDSSAKVNYDGMVMREAQEEDVRIGRCILTDDQGHVLEPSAFTQIGGVKTGTKTYHGVSVTGSQTSADYGPSDNTQTKSASFTEQDYYHTEYTASYHVSFPLFQKDGKPTLTRSARHITLHLVTEFGEKTVEYDLKPPKL